MRRNWRRSGDRRRKEKGDDGHIYSVDEYIAAQPEAAAEVSHGGAETIGERCRRRKKPSPTDAAYRVTATSYCISRDGEYYLCIRRARFWQMHFKQSRTLEITRGRSVPVVGAGAGSANRGHRPVPGEGVGGVGAARKAHAGCAPVEGLGRRANAGIEEPAANVATGWWRVLRALKGGRCQKPGKGAGVRLR